MELKDQFEDAQKRVKTLPAQPPNVLLELYGLFKQANSGAATGRRPGMFDMRGRAKYDAWNLNQVMSSDEAMQAYIQKVTDLGA